MEGISWADLDAEERRAIAILGAGLSIELCDPIVLLKLKWLGLMVGSHLTAAAHDLRRRTILEELQTSDAYSPESSQSFASCEDNSPASERPS
ncbi:hypothetical protein ABIA00_006599 [Bradyrhizobium ottawaense]|jgi:hypothetical protein